MCSGDLCNLPAAPESEDLIAIIHPTQRDGPRIPLAGKLHLSNRFADVTTSRFQHLNHVGGYTRSNPDSGVASPSSSPSSSRSTSPSPAETLHVRIHKFGQPLTDDFENPVMHSFAMVAETFVWRGQRLDLGIGGEGVVGRTVSIVTVDGGILGEGIIGIGGL